MNNRFGTTLFNVATAFVLLNIGSAHADDGLKTTIVSNEILVRSVKTLNDRGPVHGTLKKEFHEEVGTKFSFTNSTESNKTISTATRANLNVGAEIEGITGGMDGGVETTASQYTTTVKTLAKETSHLSTKDASYELLDGQEGFIGLVTDSVGGFSNSYYTQSPSVTSFSKPVQIAVTVDYTPVFKRFLSTIMQVRRDVRDNTSAWDSLFNAANFADQHDSFIAYCNAVAQFNDGMDNASWRTLAGFANEARSFYEQKQPKQAVVSFLRGFASIRSPSKNSSQWAGLAAAAQSMINEING